MKSKFFLLDITEDRSAAKPTVRLWGLDAKANRLLILANQISPYFYCLFDEGKLDSARDSLTKAREKFPKIMSIDVEQKKLLGHERNALKIVCSEVGVIAAYAKNLRRNFGGSCYEDDLRLSVRYLIDTALTNCGWQELDVQPAEVDGVSVDRVLAAEGLPSALSELAPPRFRILAFNLLTAGEQGSANPQRDPIRAIAVVTESHAEVIVNTSDDDSKLLGDFVNLIQRTNPDVIIGFESNTYAWPYLTKRSKLRKVKLAIGRDGSDPHSSLYGHVSVAGRVNLDLLDIASGILEIKVKTIENFAKYLQIPSADRAKTIDESERYPLWADRSNRQSLIDNAKDNASVLFDVGNATIDFVMQLSALTGLPLDQVMTAAVGFRVDSYLVKQAHTLGELVPPRVEQPYYTYRGAIVLEPETGVHENVVVLDFSSMYPTLMEKYNLSPETLVSSGERVAKDSAFVIPEVNHHFRKQPDGFYRTVLRKLIAERSSIKRELERFDKKSTQHRVLTERERAVKVITNACYGYAGWAGARWYSKEVAESAAALGRDTITRTIEIANKIGLNVIYGDTDSIFVKDDREKVDDLTAWVKDEFDLEIKRETEYVRVLFTEAMKRYAGLLEDGSLDIVGLEVVRGDWSDIARDVQERVIQRVLRDQSTEKAIEDVRATIRNLRTGEMSIGSLTIRKTLTKQIEDYKVRTPHVEVAKMLVKQGWDLGVGDKVAYVIAKGSGRLFQKAKPPGRLTPQDIDVEYYVDNQIKPAAMRILERFGVS
jgi:DNA polymerase I